MAQQIGEAGMESARLEEPRTLNSLPSSSLGLEKGSKSRVAAMS